MFDVALSGAGISMSSRNGAGDRLPSGDRLAEIVWTSLVSHLPPDVAGFVSDIPWPQPTSVADEFRDLFGIRLELLMETVFKSGAEHDTPEIVGNWFADLCREQFAGATPSTSHYGLLSLCPGPHLTLNFDTLLELAGANEVIHLHGSVDDPDTLVTTISQYQSGLPSPTQDKLRRALHRKRLLVAGYSGRDRDVLPLITMFQPESITWLQYPTDPPSREVRELADNDLVELISITIEDFASQQLKPPRQHQTSAATPPATACRRLPIPIAADVVLEILTQHNPTSATEFARRYVKSGLSQTRRFRRLQGRLFATTGRSRDAFRSFLDPRSVRSNLNEVAALTTRTLQLRVPNHLVANLARFAPAPAAKPTEFAARQRLAHQDHLSGNVSRGLASDTKHFWLADGVVSPQVRVNALTFHSDRLRSAGLLRRASAIQNEALRDAPYASPRTRAYLLMMYAHTCLCRDEDERCLRALDHADALIHHAPGESILTYRQGVWNDLVRANALMQRGKLESANRLIAQAAGLKRHETPLGGVLARLHLVELYSLQGDLGRLNDALRQLRVQLRRLRGRFPHLTRAARLIEIETNSAEDSLPSHAELIDIADWFGRHGYHLARARALATQHRLFGQGVTAVHIAAWRDEGLVSLINWALASDDSTRAHWILPF